jgi:hypothetical protein
MDLLDNLRGLPFVTRAWVVQTIASVAVFHFWPQLKSILCLRWSSIASGELWRPLSACFFLGGKLQTAHFISVFILATSASQFELRVGKAYLLITMALGMAVLLATDYLILTFLKSQYVLNPVLSGTQAVESDRNYRYPVLCWSANAHMCDPWPSMDLIFFVTCQSCWLSFFVSSVSQDRDRVR